MLSGLFGDPLWCVLFAYLHNNFAYDTLSYMPSRHTHTLSQSEAALNLLCWIQSSRGEIYVWVVMKINCNNAKNHTARHHCHMSKEFSVLFHSVWSWLVGLDLHDALFGFVACSTKVSFPLSVHSHCLALHKWILIVGNGSGVFPEWWWWCTHCCRLGLFSINHDYSIGT